MRQLRAGVLAAALVAAAIVLPAPLRPAHAAASLVSDPAALVNPMVGTRAAPGQEGNAGNTSPGPSMPFGMLQWAPDTAPRVPGGGYDHAATAISGFGVNRMSGAGCFAYGNLPFLPVTGSLPSDKDNATVGFSHTGESASVGYYSVNLANSVRAELTTSVRSALGRFTFPSGPAASLLVKASAGAGASNATATVVSSTEITGSVTDGRFCTKDNDYTMYFAVSFDRAFTSSQKWAPRPFVTGDGGIALTFPTGSVVQAKVGISFISVANARANRDTLTSWDVATVRTAARTAWNQLLGRVKIGGGTADEQKIFYTAMYHSLLHPNVFSDANRQYRGFDGQVRTLPTGQDDQYANFSGWDVYRSQIQLMTMLAPDRASDLVRSMLNDYEQSGRLPKWSVANDESYMMVGDPAVPTIASAFAFGARDFDTGKALAAMVAQSARPGNARPGTVYLDNLGYLPDDGGYGCCNHNGTTATSLEYHSADFALASFARQLGDTATHARFASRAQGWQHLLNPASGFIQPRRQSGEWRPGFDPTDNSYDDWAEGNSWRYTLMVPFNVHGLAAAKGGDAAMNQYLDTHFVTLNDALGSEAWMGNEASFGAPWLYAYTGQPHKTQQVVRRVQTELFRNTPDGLPGNDDLGSMSSWYVWAALGMYPAVPGTADLVLGSPLFPQTVVTLPNGATLTINAPAAQASVPFIQSMQYNGSSWDKAYLPPTALTAGGTIDLVLATTPNMAWAAGADGAPPSYGTNAVAAADNAGSSTDSSLGQSNYDQWTSSYSAEALAAAGIVPGSRLTANGITYTWPNARPGQSDNVIAQGQRLTVHSPPGATTIGVLGSAEGHVDGAAGTATIHFADGSTQQVTLAFSDWTLAGGQGSIRPDNTVVATMPYRNQALAGGKENITTYLYSASFTVDPAKAVVGMTLPTSVSGGRLHVFDIGFGGHRDNAGISDDAYPGGADVDGASYSYSRQALAAAGLRAGSTVTHNGVTYTWPNLAAGDRDNYRADGQQINVTPVAGATKIGLLGASTGWMDGAAGLAEINYTDGTTQQVTLGFSDWTLVGGSGSVGHGNTVAAQIPYRNSARHGRQSITTYVFASTFPLMAGKTVKSVTLPSNTLGQQHVFAIGTG
ncbi:alpha-1,2-mannosidase, putative [Micromonospora purpureochromogenes]|uniref:Alpha-1,2-mannosidase, putative n=1 Tax=Micromonospora purpureochromogenes TaxID=47872 RepID=A0A1C4Z104_9ACTN|nr:GH92 family glycosyl hydrolase [Micromonospora purpureochromogenes]SCF26633.1 alpha-1,2-mannosidase, putative [Micromonospora purpureochromogenes]